MFWHNRSIRFFAAVLFIGAAESLHADKLELDAPAWTDVKPELTDTPEMVSPWRPYSPADFSKHPDAKVGEVGGQPCFFVQGKPFFAMWGATWRWRRPGGKAVTGGIPFNVVTVFNDHRKWYPRMGVFDPTELERQANAWIKDNPDSYLIFDLTVTPPADWAIDNPGEMCTDDKGAVTKDGLRANWSFASVKAKDVMLEIVTHAVKYLESRPYANRILGYRVNSGHTMEWLGWYPPKGSATDFSDAARRRFAPLDVPSLAARQTPDSQTLLWDVDKNIAAIKWAQFYSDCGAEALIALCRRVKELTGGRKLVGTYYGYTMTMNYAGNSVLRGGHYALKKVLDSCVVDFLMSPQSYETRYLGGISGEMKPFASIKKHGIVPVVEDDTRTHNGPWLEKGNYGQTVTESQSVGILRRNQSFALCRGEPIYNYALVNGSELGFAAAARDGIRIREIGEKCLANKVERNAEVAIVMSETSVCSVPVSTYFSFPTGYAVQRYGKDGKVETRPRKTALFTGDVFGEIYVRFSRAGVPVDYVLAEDICSNPGSYKLYVFANCFRADENFRKAVSELRKRETTLLWLYAPGAMDGDCVGDVKAMSSLTGLKLRLENDCMAAESKMLDDGRLMGQRSARPKHLFSLEQADVVLGTYTNNSIAVGTAKTGNAQSIFCGVWALDVPFIKSVMKSADVHIYSETSDPVEANGALVALHARFPGRKTIRLPKKATVLDVFNQRVIAKDSDVFSFDAPLHSSWLFYYGDEKDAVPFKRFDRSRLLVGGYRLSHSRDHHLADMKACGIDFITGTRITDRGSLDRLAKHGIGTVAKGALPHWCGEHGENAGESSMKLPLDVYRKHIDEFIEKLDHPAVWMLGFTDEPSAKDMPHLGKVAGYVSSRVPQAMPYYNLYPSYAKVQETGKKQRRSQLGTSTYREYIEEYCRTSPLDYISFDYYMYMPKPNDRYKLYAGFYDNLNIVAEACRRTRRSLWFVPQVNSRKSDPLVPLSVNNLRFQAFTGLAFGVEAITWACYGKGWFTNNVLTAKGEKTEQYEKLRKVNQELHSIGPRYMKYRNVATHFVGFKPENGLQDIGVRLLNSLNAGCVCGIKTTDETALLVGEMVSRKKDDSMALLLVASGDPFDVSPSQRTVVFRLKNGWRVNVTGSCGPIGVSMNSDGLHSITLSQNAMALMELLPGT